MRSALTHLRVRSLAVLGRRLASLAHPRQPSCRLGHPEQRRVTAREANVAVRAEPASVGTSPGAGPARARDPAARGAARPGHRGAGRRRAARSRRARPADDDPAAARGRRRGAGGSRRAAGRPRPRPRGGRHPGVQPLLPAGEPRRGARPGPIVPAGANGRAARTRSAAAIAALAPARRRTATTRASSSRRLRITPVLTAHPTEARRRTLLLALRRVERQLARLEDPRLTPAEDRDARRRLREEITLLWRTADLRAVAPSPLDEVRTALAFFDETLFGAVPRSCRRSTPRSTRQARPSTCDAAAAAGRGDDSGRTGTRPPLVPAFLRWGSWIGGDRDGNPAVTAEVDRADDPDPRRPRPARLRGGRDAPVADASRRRRPSAARTRALADAPRPRRRAAARDLDRQLRPALPGRAVPPAVRVHRRAAPPDAGAPDRRQQAPLTRPLRRSAAELDAELAEIQDALVADGLERSAWGEVQDLRWQVATFGFHLAALEIRQHSAVHRAALEALERAADDDRRAGRYAGEVSRHVPGDRPLQGRFGEAAVDRYVVSSRVGRATFAPCSTSPRWRPSPARPTARCHSTSPRCSRTRRRWRPRARLLDAILADADVPRPPRPPRRPPGGDARLLRLEQGVRATSRRTG